MQRTVRRRTADQKAALYRVRFQADFWPAVCAAQGWDPRDEIRRRDLRARCWEEIGIPERGDAMPANDAEATALFTLCRHLAEPDNINLALRWDQCRPDFRAFNKARQADFLAPPTRRIYRGRQSAAGSPLDDPITNKEATHRLIRARTARRAAGALYEEPADELCPF